MRDSERCEHCSSAAHRASTACSGVLIASISARMVWGCVHCSSAMLTATSTHKCRVAAPLRRTFCSQKLVPLSLAAHQKRLAAIRGHNRRLWSAEDASRSQRSTHFECAYLSAMRTACSLSAAEVNQSFLRRANQFSSAPAARVRQHELATTSAAVQTAYKHSPAATVQAARRRGAA